MKVIVFHLEMTDPAQLVAPSRAVRGLAAREAAPVDPGLIRRFYLAVGERFHWVERRAWTLGQWRERAGSAALTTLVASVAGEEAGFALPDVQGGGR